MYLGRHAMGRPEIVHIKTYSISQPTSTIASRLIRSVGTEQRAASGILKFEGGCDLEKEREADHKRLTTFLPHH